MVETIQFKHAKLPKTKQNVSTDNHLYYSTRRGEFYLGFCEEVLQSEVVGNLKGKIKLIFTSPPFPLNRKKKYGNLQGSEYISWLSSFAPLFTELLTPDGSIVIELGNAWNPGCPTVSTLPMEALLEFKKTGNFHLCQEFICFNPAKLPTPAQWVTVERARVKDSFTRLWWMARTTDPDADNRRVLVPYSKDMRKLLQRQEYNAGRRPSEHVIGSRSFLKDNRGAIPPNVLVLANTGSNDSYLKYCKKHNLELHPARMQPELASFFIKFLTEEGDIVMDPFAGSNVTGATAEKLGRRWIAIDSNLTYAKGSIGRFINSSDQSQLEFPFTESSKIEFNISEA